MRDYVLWVFVSIAGTFTVINIFQSLALGDSVSRVDILVQERLSSHIIIREVSSSVGGTYQHTHDRPTRVRYRDFQGDDPQNHYATADGKPIPGDFRVRNNEGIKKWIYIMGARLTASYKYNNDDIHLTLFGLPGHTRYPSSGHFHCEKDRHLMPPSPASTKLRVYAQVECPSNLYNRTEISTRPGFCHGPTKLHHVPFLSWDDNANHLALIWQLNISEAITAHDIRLISKIPAIGAEHRKTKWKEEKAIRISFWLAQSDIPSSKLPPKRPTLSVDIPLSTGVVGSAGPQIRKRPTLSEVDNPPLDIHPSMLSKSFLGAKPIGASICVASFGKRIVQYIPEFVQHHKNLGFEQIVVGVLDDTMDIVKSRLLSFIEEGTVTIASTTTPGLECDTELLKILFYQPCLYHSKGIASYVGVWDLDEFWLPPPTSFPLLSQQNHHGSSSRNVSSLLQADKSWKVSRYSQTFTVAETMTALEQYHFEHGCRTEDWCFHGFPSVVVNRKKIGNDPVSRTGIISKDFEFREEKSNRIWLKSIGKTDQVFASGYHEFGSCYAGSAPETWYDPNFINETLRNKMYSDLSSAEGGCRNIRGEGFGSLHHFVELVASRPGFRTRSDKQVMDEYVDGYGTTVLSQLQLQLQRLN